MATSRGIVRAQRDDLEAVADGRAAHLKNQLLDLSDGLPSVECASGVQPTCARDARGRLWFATSKGVAVVDPAQFLLNTNPPPLQIESVVYHTARGDATERRIEAPFASRLVLPAGSRRIEIHYAALAFTAPEKARFQVRLEGQEAAWNDVGGQRSALYHEVPPGHYTFRVRAANNDGVWNEAGTSLAFTVRPFFWETAWCASLLGAVLGATLLVGYRRRMAKLESRRLAQEAYTRQLIGAQESERARLARELHDDITQRLARLAIDAGRVELASTGGSNIAETMRGVREGLVRLSEDVHTLSYRLHSSLLEDLGLVEALKAECERFSRQESIAYQLNLQDVSDSLPNDTALGLFRIAQEALRNVSRHARASAVAVTLRCLDDGLQLAVSDNGNGFDPLHKRERVSLGLASMRERMHLLGGELDIESAPGQGTTIVAWVPLPEKQT
jgi:signal transduction histidine kinase